MEKLIVGIFSGCFFGIIIYFVSYTKRLAFQKKFNIAGEYITKYEDEKDGEIVICSAPATIEQRGNVIKGGTYLNEDHRKWLIEGKISKDGYLYGYYKSANQSDKSIGNFFLKIENNDNLNGLWSGFDSINNKINSGKYNFKRKFEDFALKRINKEHYSQIIELTNKELGDEYITTQFLESIVTDNFNNFGMVAVNFKNKVIGFYICYIMDLDQVESNLKIPLEKMQGSLTNNAKIGVLKTIAIDKKYKGYGIGTSLVNDSISQFRSRNIQSVISIGWKRRYNINIGNILHINGFKQVIELRKYWEQDSISKGYRCPECGNPPCRCSAVIFQLDL